MNWAVIAISPRGAERSNQIFDCLQEYGDCIQYTYEPYAGEGMQSFGSVSSLIQGIFRQYDGLVFVGACGIAVRSISGLVNSKTTDPAVLVVDEQGQFVISLLSGHIGGANAFTELVAEHLSAVPVITTATDTGKLFSPDSFAAANQLYIQELKEAKRVAVELLQGKPVGLYCEYPCIHVPEELTIVKEEEKTADIQTGIYIGENPQAAPFIHTLHLLPKNLVLGAGCRKNISPQLFEEIMLEKLEDHDIMMERIIGVATIDLKKEEPAILAFCEKYQLPLHTFSAQELMAVPGSFHNSPFVYQTTGADNVCERSAMACVGQGELLVKKQAEDGVTMAVAARKVRLDASRKNLRDSFENDHGKK